MRTPTSDGPIFEVVERIKPVAGKTVEVTVKPAMRLITGLRYDPNPTRTKIKLGTKWAVPALFVGMIIARRTRKNSK